ncbi:metallophosphoesterase family protein [Candidatus Poriferisodalis sp.]|uniref:metallophosphoesterase family protein n=1 Tax=Candidatus Poriferisodalis sp. TaxID=3101277 RepID=UPI003B0201BB
MSSRRLGHKAGIEVSGRSPRQRAVASCFAVKGLAETGLPKVLPETGHTLRVLHTSDVHVGYVRGPHGTHRDVCQCSIHALVETAVAHRADVLLIAGDLFDHARLKRSDVAHTMNLLGDLDASVVIIPGNHDVHDERTLWGTHADHEHRLEVTGAGVIFLDDPEGATLHFDEHDLTLWGRAMDSHDSDYRPLAGVPPRPDTGWFIAAGHGHFQRTADDAHRSSPIAAEEIEATGADYVALGHWHVTTDVSVGEVIAWYPGAPMGMPSNGTACLVTFETGVGDSGRSVSVDHVDVTPPGEGCAGW